MTKISQTPEDIEGVVHGHRDGHGFVVRSDGAPDIYLAPNEMRAVLHKDQVKVRVVRTDRKGRPEGRVIEIIDRPAQPIIGRLLQESGVWLVAPEDKRYGQDVLIPKGATGMARVGQIVVVDLQEPPALFGQPVGRIREVLGNADDPGMEIEIAVRKYGVPHVFSEAAVAQARMLPDKVRAADAVMRVDLTDLAFVTIDGEDARDFDDAVYCTSLPDGWRLLVAIADVSHYVEPGSAIDADALERATSVYFPRRVIPMLPEKLSNGLCSLNPQVERLCMVCDMVVSTEGVVHAYQFYPGVMFSHARLTYTETAAIVSNTRGAEAQKRKDRVQDLLNLHGVYQALLQARNRRGAIDFETTETQIVCDELGRIERIVPRTRNVAHRMIEEMMLAANVCSADFILRNEHPGLFRVHEGPTPEKVQALRDTFKALGLALSVSDVPTPAEFQAVTQATRERPDAQQIQTLLLRSMQQAVYTPDNRGHFGLAYAAYTHFTSPIRRYPDLLVHRVIKAILAKKRYKLELEASALRSLPPSRNAAPAPALARKSAADKKTPRKDDAIWVAAGTHCSANERRADEASRDVEAWLKCLYMKAHLGEEYSGLVSAVTSFGVFVTLDTLYVEGLVHITELGGDYFRFDEARRELRGERSGIRYSLGSRMQVQVSRVDLDGRRIDFRLVTDNAGAKDARAASAAYPGSNARERTGVFHAATDADVELDDFASSKPVRRKKSASAGGTATRTRKSAAPPSKTAKRKAR